MIFNPKWKDNDIKLLCVGQLNNPYMLVAGLNVAGGIFKLIHRLILSHLWICFFYQWDDYIWKLDVSSISRIPYLILKLWRFVFVFTFINSPTAFAYSNHTVHLKYVKNLEFPEGFAYRFFSTNVEGADKLSKLCAQFSKNRRAAYYESRSRVKKIQFFSFGRSVIGFENQEIKNTITTNFSLTTEILQLRLLRNFHGPSQLFKSIQVNIIFNRALGNRTVPNFENQDWKRRLMEKTRLEAKVSNWDSGGREKSYSIETFFLRNSGDARELLSKLCPSKFTWPLVLSRNSQINGTLFGDAKIAYGDERAFPILLQIELQTR